MHMVVSLTMLIIFCTDFTSSMQCFPKRRPVIYSIMNFVNTRQRIWTYKISQGGRLRCQYNVMRSINPQEIVYNRTCSYDRQRRSIALLGEFDARHIDRMYVRTDDGRTYYEIRNEWRAKDNKSEELLPHCYETPGFCRVQFENPWFKAAYYIVQRFSKYVLSKKLDDL
ncbi:uncharacterized protein LOC142772311 [Rhipicephalus microplus]|uniref:uncharacterized protein LOC142772311 n=1 Tax=Rhipicephalus microplus TaxID=6941 RepID=UPI003F6D5D00